MYAFEISPDDVQSAVKRHFNKDVDDLTASRLFDKLDLQAVSDAANFDDEGGYADVSGMEAATIRAEDEVAAQIKTKKLL